MKDAVNVAVQLQSNKLKEEAQADNGDFNILRRQDIEYMLLLLFQEKLTNLNLDEWFALNVALRMYTRRIVIQECVKDLQLAVKSYQKKINLSKQDSYRSDITKMTPYTAYHDIQGIFYQDDMNKNCLMRTDKLHKFSDSTLNHVCIALNDIATGIQMEYLPKKNGANKTSRELGTLKDGGEGSRDVTTTDRNDIIWLMALMGSSPCLNTGTVKPESKVLMIDWLGIVVTSKVNHIMETDIVKLVVEIESFGMSYDDFDKETGSFDGLQPKQVNLCCVHALNKLHLHELYVVLTPERIALSARVVIEKFVPSFFLNSHPFFEMVGNTINIVTSVLTQRELDAHCTLFNIPANLRSELPDCNATNKDSLVGKIEMGLLDFVKSTDPFKTISLVDHTIEDELKVNTGKRNKKVTFATDSLPTKRARSEVVVISEPRSATAGKSQFVSSSVTLTLEHDYEDESIHSDTVVSLVSSMQADVNLVAIEPAAEIRDSSVPKTEVGGPSIPKNETGKDLSMAINKGIQQVMEAGVEHGKAGRTLTHVEAYDPEVESKYVAVVEEFEHASFSQLEELEALKNSLLALLMFGLNLEDDHGDMVPPSELCRFQPASDQVTMPVYSKQGSAMGLGYVFNEMLLSDALAAVRKSVHKRNVGVSSSSAASGPSIAMSSQDNALVVADY
uniref:Uncharacterized protein n=1 Tax=Tanacetum cinerariifolium TaxID=118510 RepID=A0A6L2MQY7_TANCI|nr:hypothetical protein [Tanacetum cinerariifolium]